LDADAASANQYWNSSTVVFGGAKHVTIVDQHIDKPKYGGAKPNYNPARLLSAATRDGTADHGKWSTTHINADAACTRPNRMASADVEVDERDSGSEDVR